MTRVTFILGYSGRQNGGAGLLLYEETKFEALSPTHFLVAVEFFSFSFTNTPNYG